MSSPSNIQVAPAEITFGDWEINAGISLSRQITVRNQGIANLVFECPGIEIVGPDSADFSVVVGDWNCGLEPSGKVLRQFESYSFELRFDPSSVGDKEATFRITTNDPARPVVEVPLRGTGILYTPTPTATATFTPSPTATLTPSFSPTPTSTASPSNTPTATNDYDVEPEVPDGQIDARDLLAWFGLVKTGSAEETHLFGIATLWHGPFPPSP
jgi:hypothetical protein